MKKHYKVGEKVYYLICSIYDWLDKPIFKIKSATVKKSKNFSLKKNEVYLSIKTYPFFRKKEIAPKTNEGKLYLIKIARAQLKRRQSKIQENLNLGTEILNVVNKKISRLIKSIENSKIKKKAKSPVKPVVKPTLALNLITQGKDGKKTNSKSQSVLPKHRQRFAAQHRRLGRTRAIRRG